jgi:hypothetical protein
LLDVARILRAWEPKWKTLKDEEMTEWPTVFQVAAHVVPHRNLFRQLFSGVYKGISTEGGNGRIHCPLKL